MFWFLAIGAIALLICLAVPWNMFFGSKKQPSLEGKHVVITGGTSGIGLAMAKQVKLTTTNEITSPGAQTKGIERFEICVARPLNLFSFNRF